MDVKNLSIVDDNKRPYHFRQNENLTEDTSADGYISSELIILDLEKMVAPTLHLTYTLELSEVLQELKKTLPMINPQYISTLKTDADEQSLVSSTIIYV